MLKAPAQGSSKEQQCWDSAAVELLGFRQGMKPREWSMMSLPGTVDDITPAGPNLYYTARFLGFWYMLVFEVMQDVGHRP